MNKKQFKSCGGQIHLKKNLRKREKQTKLDKKIYLLFQKHQ